ncbi:MAG: vWA domain-containing protein, partial [Planctomycetota bacterium]
MYRTGTRTLWTPVVALALGLLATTARADEQDDAAENAPTVRPRSDAVYLLDVSGSMRKQRALRRAKELLTKLLDKVVQPGTRAAVIPFGSGVHRETRFEIPERAAGAARERQRMTETIDGMLPRDTYTYLFEAVYAGLETLMEFKQANPGHSRHIVLVSDGKQLVPRDEKTTTLREILEHFTQLKFHPGEDWFIWYAHIGPPDPVLKQALERTGAGQTVPLDQLASLNWAVTRFNTNVIYGGRKLPGNWTHRQRLTAQTDASGVGRKVFFRIVAPDLPKGMVLSVQPREQEITGETTVFDLKIG